jgi:hypothetical protein
MRALSYAVESRAPRRSATQARTNMRDMAQVEVYSDDDEERLVLKGHEDLPPLNLHKKLQRRPSSVMLPGL